MKLLLSTPLHLFLLDVETHHATLLRTGDGYYYGITSKENRVVLTHTGGYLQYFDNRGVIRTVKHLLQPHQAEWVDNFILIANTGKNCISVFDEQGNFCRDVYLNHIKWDDKSKGRSGNHFNSVHRVGDRIYVVAHNYERPSEVWELAWPELEVLGSKASQAAWAHNVWPGEHGLVICDSKHGSLYDLNSQTTIWRSSEESVMTRGLAVSSEYIFVGSSMLNKRKDRYWKTGGVWVVDRTSLKTLDKITLPGAGDVHEIRLVDVPDACHNSEIISAKSLTVLQKRSVFIDWAYSLRKKYSLFQQDLFPLSQLVRASQLIIRGKRPPQPKQV
jgi:hypothetical protein